MIKKYLSELVRFETLSLDHRENTRALEWFKNELRGLPLVFQEFKSNGFPSLFISTRKTKKPKILLQAHIDVVGGSKKNFMPRVSGSALFGRVVFDMKFAAACYVELFKRLGKKLSDMDIAILLTTDEEIGGKHGVGEFINRGFSCDFFVLPDGGENWTLQKSAKGILQLSVTSTGKSAHGSRPWTGSNAVENLTDFLVRFKKIFPIEPCGDSEHFHSTASVGSIRGGEEINKIPDYAETKIDIRLVPGSGSVYLGRIQKLVKKHPGIVFKIVSQADPYSLPTYSYYHKEFVKILSRKIGFIPEFINSHGSSDARYFVNKKIPGILLRPIGGGHHTEKEWINLPSLQVFYEVLYEFVVNHAVRVKR